MKKVISILFVICILLGSILPAAAVETLDADESSTTELVTNNGLQETLDAYFGLRNEMLSGDSFMTETECEANLVSLSDSQTVNSKMIERLSVRDNLAHYQNIFVIDSSVSFRVESIKEIDSSVCEVEVYEWTWIQYNDGQGGNMDEMGFATEHVLTLQQYEDGSYVIINDDFDDSDILWVPESQECSTAVDENLSIQADTNASIGVNNRINSGLYVDTLIAYADAWVPHTTMADPQNPSYYNTTKYTVYGADCANYVSQCLMEGGMKNDYTGEMDNEDWTGSQWWFRVYESAEIGSYNASPPSWRVVSTFTTYWTSKGYSLVSATNDTVFPGNPVIQNGGHLMICVGYNSQGVPILNAHNSDAYHVPLSSISGTLTTIQIIGMKHTTHTNFTYSNKDAHVHTCRCTGCRNLHDEVHTWVAYGTAYRCSVCLTTSAFLPSSLDIPVENTLS